MHALHAVGLAKKFKMPPDERWGEGKFAEGLGFPLRKKRSGTLAGVPPRGRGDPVCAAAWRRAPVEQRKRKSGQSLQPAQVLAMLATYSGDHLRRSQPSPISLTSVALGNGP